jgi:hypothetical protein
MGFLEVSAAELARRNMCGERQHRNATSMTVIQTVDQVQMARSRTAGADAQLAREVRLGAGGKGTHLLVAHLYPCHVVVAENCICEAVQGVAGYAVDPSHAHAREHVYDHLRDILLSCHG